MNGVRGIGVIVGAVAWLAAAGCYQSHERADGRDAGATRADGRDAGATRADGRDAGATRGDCETPERCDHWVTVSWRADVAPGRIDHVLHTSDMWCYEGTIRENRTTLGPDLDVREPSLLTRVNVCHGCFFAEARAMSAAGDVLARDRADFCVDPEPTVVLDLTP